MKNYIKPTLTKSGILGFESIYAFNSGEETSGFSHSCCSCPGSHPNTYKAFYEFHCMNCSNRLPNGFCCWGKNTGTP